ncbi:hypothetical protein J2Z50_006455 [Ensifer mexicanus]|nr:hypothetical protein [Sinorhizobium mexicanum]
MFVPVTVVGDRTSSENVGLCAFRKDPRLLLVRPIPPLAPTGGHLDPTIPSLMPGFNHDFKHGISAISNHSFRSYR